MGEIFVIHPSINIFDVLIEELVKRKNEDCFVLFPHRRAIQFLGYYLSQNNSYPFLMPEAKAISDWVAEYYVKISDPPKTILSIWDQIWFVYQALVEVYNEEGKTIPSWEELLPWCFYLIKLFGELDKELIQPKDLHYPPSEKLPEQAEKILERQGKIYQSFVRFLEKINATTPEQALRYLAEKDVPLPEGPDTFIVGFYALSRAEKRIFEKMLEKGAKLYIQSDPENPAPLHKKLLEEWRKRFEIVEINNKKDVPEFFFFEAYDLHSELKEAGKLIRSLKWIKRPDEVAILLPEPSSLIPLLHYFPEIPVNITMGYPFNLTPVSLFFNILFDLILFVKKHKAFSKNLLYQLIKSPYLEGFKIFSSNLSSIETEFLSKERIFELAGAEKIDVERLLKDFIDPLLEAETILDAVEVLERVVCFLRKKETLGIFEKEALAVFVEKVLFPAKRLFFAKEKIGIKNIIKYFKECLKFINIPFEGDPLEGVQIMGLLESRLLNFEKVIILEANEGILPKVEEINPLLPQEVRKILGISDREKEEEIVRYHFERLISGAKKIYFFWQHCITPGMGEIESKKVKSRFVEKVIWEIEKKYNLLFENTPYKDRFKKVSISYGSSFKGIKEPLKKDEKVKEKIIKLLKENVISPSLLDEYIKCPIKFFYSKVLELSPLEKRREIPHHELGIVVHTALERYFRNLTKLTDMDLKGRLVKKEDIKFEDFWKIFTEELKKKGFYKELSPEKRFFLEETARFRLKEYLLFRHPFETKVVALEHPLLDTVLLKKCGKVSLYGKIDRIDLIEKEDESYYLIIDYKTGGMEGFNNKFLQLSASQLDSFDEKSLKLLRKGLSTFQFLFYIYLLGKSLKKQFKTDSWSWSNVRAGYVDLRKDGKLTELSLRKHNLELYCRWFEEEFEPCLDFLLSHIIESPFWYPSEKYNFCIFCEYRNICRYGF